DESFLYGGARLAVALEWRARNESRLSELEREFLTASEARKIRAKEEREAAQQRELQAAHELAEVANKLAEEAKQRAGTEKRSSARLRYFLAGLAILLIASVVAAFVAYGQHQQSLAESKKNQELLYVADMKAASQASDRG